MRNPLIIWLLTHSMHEALPLAISSFSLTAFLYMRKEQNKGKVWGRMWRLCDTLPGDGESLAFHCRVAVLMAPWHWRAHAFVYVRGQIWWQCSAVTLKSPGTSNIIELQCVCIYGMWAREKERELISTFLSLMCFPDPYSQIFFSWCNSFASLLSKPAQPQSIGFTDW